MALPWLGQNAYLSEPYEMGGIAIEMCYDWLGTQVNGGYRTSVKADT